MSDQDQPQAPGPDLAERIQQRIFADVTDRRGWRQEWHMFAADIQQEVVRVQTEIIRAELRADPGLRAVEEALGQLIARRGPFSMRADAERALATLRAIRGGGP